MITLKNLRWSNAFSYGSNNEIALDKDPITQLVGKNGHGKSSIALILEEVLYNKNSKGIKKADILNRYTKDKNYSIELELEKDGVLYTVKTVRGTTQSTVKLFKENLDISSHTATQTYKSIEELIGMDHKAFSQIVYQSNASSLEFLTSTDSVRKKFLIDLLDLGIYTKAGELFKQLSTDLNKEIAACQAKVNTVSGWLNKYVDVDLTRKVLVEEPVLDPQLEQTVAEQSAQLLVVEQTNKKIAQNNNYKKMLSEIVLQPLVEPVNAVSIVDLKSEVAVLNQQNKEAELFIKKLNSLSAAGRCPTCDSNIDQHTTKSLVQEKQNAVASNKAKLLELDTAITKAQNLIDSWQAANKQQEQWERLHQLIDHNLQETFLDKTTIATEIETLNLAIKQAKTKLKQAQDYNKAAESHNAQLTLIESQLQEFKQDLETYTTELTALTDRSNTIGVLTKTFSTSGLVAYKIESLVKDLEGLANEFLQELSDGRFQIGFEISSKDKLNVVITDNSKDIDIMALSGGERARVNAAMLLAIRKLMQSLSSSRINLLILDETIEALDVDGKEKLIDTLIKEPGLNTFLVSHGFTHPLLEKLYVVKSNNVSRIEA